jgi:uncharacterized protein (DUF433 family)
MAPQRERAIDRIIQDPRILMGKPVVRGTRIPVELVLEYLSNNPNFDELFADYPRLTMEDVKACFAYAQRKVGKTRRATSAPSTSAWTYEIPPG